MVAARLAGLPQPLVARVAALPPRRQELIQDLGLGVALAAVNVVSLLLSRAKRASIRAAQSRADRAEAELDRQSAQAAERERTRIARELHEVVAHHVSLIAVQAEAATSLLPGRPGEARRSVEIIGDTARQALTELRRLLGVLRRPSERLETAPSASLGQLGDVLTRSAGPGCPSIWRSWARRARWHPAWT